MDKLIILLLVAEVGICCMCAIGAPIFIKLNHDKHWYLAFNEPSVWDSYDPNKLAVVGALHWLTSLILLSTLIPISLYISIEFIKIITKAVFLSKDVDM